MIKLSRYLFAALVSLWSLTFCMSVAPASAAEGGSTFFAPTGYAVSGKFLDYWNLYGGLATFGYPITGTYYEKDPISGKAYLTQWFERNRFELHPEYANTQYEVLLGLLGRQVTASRTGEGPFQPVPQTIVTPNRTYFPLTGHYLSGVFKQYWEASGGLSLYGYPISETFMEQNPSDGNTYLVQYFERNRFEYHPEKSPPYNVLLGLLGEQVKQLPLAPVIDNRSTALGILNSYYNAINLKDYQRAYNYWQLYGNGSSNPNTFNVFAAGFSQTAAVNVATGPVYSDGTAGTVYYSVPVVIISSQKDGTQQHFYGCYRVAQVDVQIGDHPLPNPLYINFAKIFAASTNFNEFMLMDAAQKLIAPNNICVS